jgi:hypothetical protein
MGRYASPYTIHVSRLTVMSKHECKCVLASSVVGTNMRSPRVRVAKEEARIQGNKSGQSSGGSNTHSRASNTLLPLQYVTEHGAIVH